jgi:hypothetical protein
LRIIKPGGWSIKPTRMTINCITNIAANKHAWNYQPAPKPNETPNTPFSVPFQFAVLAFWPMTPGYPQVVGKDILGNHKSGSDHCLGLHISRLVGFG